MRQQLSVNLRTFIVAVAVLLSLSVILCVFISINSANRVKMELQDTNYSKVEEISKTLRDRVYQIDRLAAGIGVSTDAKLFFTSPSPDILVDDFYTRIKYILSSYAFSMKDTIASFMLYSWKENRLMADDVFTPYFPKDERTNLLNNAEWISQIEPLSNGERSRITFVYRATNNSYPYVWTLVHQMAIEGYEGVVAADIDLSKMYSAIVPNTMNDTSVWVLDKEGHVIITENKKALFQDLSEFELLQFFDATVNDNSDMFKIGENTVAFGQKYLDDLKVYVVVVTELGNLEHTLASGSVTLILLFVTATLIAILLIYLYTYYTSKPMNRLLELVRNPNILKEKQYDENDPYICETVDFIVSQIQENNLLASELEKRVGILRNTQLQALKAQINPHFLFNTLGIIMMLLDDGVDPQAQQVTLNLSDVLRFSLSDDNLTSLRDELLNSKRYLQILEVRYAGKFHTFFDVDEKLLDVRVPRLVLQPIIENAVFHGISAKDEGGCKLTIRCYEEDSTGTNGSMRHVFVDISDDGVGIPYDKLADLNQALYDEDISMTHIGLQNVAKRLRLLYPTDSSFEIRSQEGIGTTVSLMFPAADLPESDA